AQLTLFAGGQRQDLYYSPYRGFMSTMDDRAHFGLGRATRIDSLRVQWPDGAEQTLTNLDADQLVIVKQSNASRPAEKTASTPRAAAANANQWFFPISLRGLRYKQPNATAMDYGRSEERRVGKVARWRRASY